MTNRIIGGLLIKNEYDRYLKMFLENNLQIFDRLVVVDDHSTDNTLEYLHNYDSFIPINVFTSTDSMWSKQEWRQRKRLFDLCQASCKEGDYIMILDCDEIISKPLTLRNRLQTCAIDCVALRLYDMWSKDYYRDDKYWMAHKSFYPLIVKNKKINAVWNPQSLHCGRLPMNYSIENILNFEEAKIKHYGWSDKSDRLIKYARYMAVDPDGKYGWLDQYKSILDEYPKLVKFEE